MPVDPKRESWKPGMSFEYAVEEIDYIKGLAAEMGGAERIKRQHDGGRYTIRERVEKFVDPGSFIEAGPLVGAAEYDADGNLAGFTPGGFVMGLAEVNGAARCQWEATTSRSQVVARTTCGRAPGSSPSRSPCSTASPTCS